jgi:hypothetical protein
VAVPNLNSGPGSPRAEYLAIVEATAMPTGYASQVQPASQRTLRVGMVGPGIPSNR